MTRILLILLVAWSAGAQDWVSDFGGSGVTITRAVTTDNSGNAYAVGTFGGTTTIGTSNLVSAGGNDMFLTSYDPQGNFLWAKRYGSTGNETPTTIVLDAAGSIYVAGVFTATANFGGTNVVALGSAGGFIAKYSSTGNFVWSQAINSTNFAHANGIALNSAQNAIVLAGDYQGSVTVTSTNTFVSASGGEDSFLAEYNTTNGFAIWGKTWGSLDFDSAQAIFFDHSDNLIVAGTFAFQINFGSVTIQSYPTTRDFYAVKFPASGTVAPGNATWAKSYGTLHDTVLSCAALDLNGNITLGGHFTTSTDIGTGVLTGGNSVSLCLGNYSSVDGTPIWTKGIGSTVSITPNSLSYDSLGNLSVCGNFVGTANLGGATLVGANNSIQEAFLAQYTVAGVPLNARMFGGSSANNYDALGVCNNGTTVMVVGYLSGSCSFGFTTITATGPIDGYLVRLGSATTPFTYRYPRDTWPYWKAGLTGYTSPVYSTTLYLTNFGSISDGTTDNSAAWTNCYNTAVDLTTIVMPPGITKITNFVALKPGKRVRVVGTGAKGGSYGIGKSMLLLSAGNPNGSSSDGAPIIVGGDATRNKILVTGNFARGSTTLAVNSIAGVTNGQHARFYETNDNKAYILANYPYQFWDGLNSVCVSTNQTNVWGVFEAGNTCSNSFAHQGQSFTVTSAIGNSINISSPLYWPYIALSNVPTLETFVNTATGIGLENLVINYTGTADYVAYLAYANQCWITDCCISNANHATVQLLDANNCLVRSSFIIGHKVMDSNARECVALSQYSCDNIIENNPLELGNIAVKIQESCAGNVVGYNFSHMAWVTNSGNPVIDGSVLCPVYGEHGDNGIYNLWEGNIGPQYSSDDFWGGSRSGTTLRNWWTRDGYSGLTGTIRFNQGGEAVDIDTTNWYFTAIGNVLGSGRDVGDANAGHTVANFGFARSKLPTPNVPPAAPADTNVSATLFWHGNYNMVSQSASWSNGVAQVVSNSFYLTSAPFWFGTFNWPPIGPDIAASIGSGINLSNTILIPAQASEMFSNNLIFPDPQSTKQPLSTNVFTSQTALFTVTAQGNSTLTYQWKTNGVAAGTNGPALAVGPAVNVWSGMTVTCTVTNLGGSVTSSTATLTVTPDPVILTQPQNATVGVGSTATFTVVVTNQNAVTYQWSKNGSTVGGATSSAYTTPATIAADNNSHFFVVATDSFGSVQSANATLTVTNIVSPPDPVITSQPQSTNIFTSQSALFQLTATGASTRSYAWQTNGVSAGTNGPALSLGPCPTIWSGMAVLCVVSDLAGSVTSSIATLTVSPDPVITSQPANATAVAGATASFVVSATGQSALSFQWFRNGVFVAGANSSGYTTPPLTSSNNGDTYNSVVTDTAGSLASANATLTVTSPPPTNNVGKITNAHIGKAHIGP